MCARRRSRTSDRSRTWTEIDHIIPSLVLIAARCKRLYSINLIEYLTGYFTKADDGSDIVSILEPAIRGFKRTVLGTNCPVRIQKIFGLIVIVQFSVAILRCIEVRFGQPFASSPCN